MANHSEPNAQNSELDPRLHPSGARIEKMMNGAKAQSADGAQSKGDQLKSDQLKGEKGSYGETLRPSEREDSYSPTKDKAEGERSVTGSPSGDSHRRTPSTRQQ